MGLLFKGKRPLESGFTGPQAAAAPGDLPRTVAFLRAANPESRQPDAKSRKESGYTMKAHARTKKSVARLPRRGFLQWSGGR